MSEQTRLKFVQGNGEEYIDFMAALSAVNQKQYHQVKRDGTPMEVHATITVARGTNVNVHHAPSTWRTRNAVKMTSKGWKKQLKSADVKLKDLPRYGRNLRLALEAAATTSETRNTVVQQTITKQLEPVNADGTAAFSAYDDTADTNIDYDFANPVTLVPVSNPSTGAIVDYPLILCTDIGTDDFNVIEEYLGARRNVEDLETDAPGPVATNKMTTLFSTAEELSDDIIAAVDDFGDNRPYSETSWKLMDAGQVSSETNAASGTDKTALYPGNSLTFKAPLGLIKLSGGAESNIYYVDIHAITEM